MLQAADEDGSGEMEFREFVFMLVNATGDFKDTIQMQLNEMREVRPLVHSLSFRHR